MSYETVKFIHSWRGYAQGEVAGFKPRVVSELVRQGIAEKQKPNGKGRKKLDGDKQEALDKRKKQVGETSVKK